MITRTFAFAVALVASGIVLTPALSAQDDTRTAIATNQDLETGSAEPAIRAGI